MAQASGVAQRLKKQGAIPEFKQPEQKVVGSNPGFPTLLCDLVKLINLRFLIKGKNATSLLGD
jgi:hypothetical protein